MAGSILGQDQIKKVNAAYPRLLAHIKDLSKADPSAYGLMKIHFLTEFLDTTELAAIFTGMPFLAPAEKRALVRAAIYEVLLGKDIAVVVPEAIVTDSRTVPEVAKTFTPPQFSLNINKSSSFTGQAPKDVNVAQPKTTSTVSHTSKVAEQVKEGQKQMDAQAAKSEAAVEIVRKTDAKDVR